MGWPAALAGLALALAVSPVSAQPSPSAPPANTVEGITVIAPKLEQDKLPEMVTKFVQGHGATSRIEQLSRWSVPLCPQTGGLSAPFNAYVSARVKLVAAAVGAPLERQSNRNFPCKTNLLIIFTTRPQELMDNVRKHHSDALGFHYAAQAERLAHFDRPFKAWYVTGTQAEGDLIQEDKEFGMAQGGAAGSRLTKRLASRFIGVLVVIDANQIIGHQIRAISDDVAMLSLARANDLKGCSQLPTILDFLSPECPVTADPEGLSAYDVAYLKG
ncbi:MAG TPA: hypothetical protein VGN89_01220, partial [Phenylobacterium sp.]|nr:hypothetical protein [Phenylobacterium sp.]